MRRYTVLLYPEPEEGGYSVIVPWLPGCVTQGETVEEALSNAREAIEGYIAAEADRSEEVPDGVLPPVVASVEVADSPAPVPAGGS